MHLKTHKKESSMAAELSFHREVYNLWVVNMIMYYVWFL